MSGEDAGSVGAIVLAAGGSSRLGRPKQLLKLAGQSLVRRAATAAVEGGCDPVVVVTGSSAEAVGAELAGMAVRCVFHAGWADGMGSSLRAGLKAILSPSPGTLGEGWGEGRHPYSNRLKTSDDPGANPLPNPPPEDRRRGEERNAQSLPEISAVVVLVCDQPHLNGAVIRELIAAWRKSGQPMAACFYGDSLGPPCCFARSRFASLASIGDSQGAKQLLKANPAAVAQIAWPQGAIDIDTPEQWTMDNG